MDPYEPVLEGESSSRPNSAHGALSSTRPFASAALGGSFGLSGLAEEEEGEEGEEEEVAAMDGGSGNNGAMLADKGLPQRLAGSFPKEDQMPGSLFFSDNFIPEPPPKSDEPSGVGLGDGHDRSNLRKSSRNAFNPFLQGIAGFSLSPTAPSDGSPIIPSPSHRDGEDTFLSTTRRQLPGSFPTLDAYPTPRTPSSSSLPQDDFSPPPFDDEDDAERERLRSRRRLRKQNSSFTMLQPTSGSDDTAKRIEEAAKQARLKAVRNFDHSNTNSAGPSTPLPPPSKPLPTSEPHQDGFWNKNLKDLSDIRVEQTPSSPQSPTRPPPPSRPPPPIPPPSRLPPSIPPPEPQPAASGSTLTSPSTPNPPDKTLSPSRDVDDPSRKVDIRDLLEQTLLQLQQSMDDTPSAPMLPRDQERDRSTNKRTNPEFPVHDPVIPLLQPPSPQPPSPQPPSPQPPSLLPTPPPEDWNPWSGISSTQQSTLTTPIVDPRTKELEDEIQLLRSQVRDFREQVGALAVEKIRLVGRHRSEKDDLEQRLKSQIRDNERLEGESRTKAMQIVRLQSDLQQSTSRADNLSKENSRLATLNRDQKTEIVDLSERLKHQIDENRRMEKERRDVAKMKEDLKAAQTRYEAINKEKSGWQGQIDLMQNRLSDAERRERCLDEMSRHRLEAKFNSQTVGRSALLHHSPHVKGPSPDVIGAVGRFNQEVLQASNLLVENLERPRRGPYDHAPSSGNGKARAKTILGERVTVMLEQQARDTTNPTLFKFLLMQNCLEVFITHWCVNIMEAWYPQQPSFSDLLVELTSQTGGARSGTLSTVLLRKNIIIHRNKMILGSTQQICGRQTQIIQTKASPPNFGDWVKEMIQELASILQIGGVEMRQNPQRPDLFASKLLPIVEMAYNLRLAMAEKDICGGLELAAPAPDIPFSTAFMEEEHAFDDRRKKKKSNGHAISWAEADCIAGTSEVGLKRTLNGQPGVYEMVVKPKVVLVRVLEESA